MDWARIIGRKVSCALVCIIFGLVAESIVVIDEEADCELSGLTAAPAVQSILELFDVVVDCVCVFVRGDKGGELPVDGLDFFDCVDVVGETSLFLIDVEAVERRSGEESEANRLRPGARDMPRPVRTACVITRCGLMR
jgi:hypothetical protein